MHERLGWMAIGWWTALFCIHRAAVLWFGFDGAFYWEETYRLLIAEALWHRWPWPLLDLQADPYAGGSLVFGALVVPAVALGRGTLIDVKLVAIAWNAAGLAAWTALVARWWGRRAGHVFAFLFVLGPPLFVVYGVIAMGSHAEVATLAGLQLLLAYRVLYGAGRAPALASWGAVAGLGVWFTYDAALPFGVCVLVGLAAGRLPPRRLLPLAAGVAVGLAPWIATNVASSGRGIDVLVRTFGSDAPGRRSFHAMGEYFGYLLQTGIPLALRYPAVAIFGGPPRRLFLGHVYLALYAASTALVANAWWRGTAPGEAHRGPLLRPELPLLLIFPTLVLALTVSDQVFLEHPRVPFFSFRLLVPFLPAVFAVLAIAAARLPRMARWPTLVVFGLIGAIGTAHLLRAGATERSRQVTEARDTGAEAAGHLLFYKHGLDVPLLEARIDAMPAELRAAARRGVGFSIAYHIPATEPATRFVDGLATIPTGHRPSALQGAHLALGTGLEHVPPRSPSSASDRLAAALSQLDRQKSDQ